MIDRLLDGVVDESTMLNWSEERGWEPAPSKLGQEMALALYVDRTEIATLMCTPEKLNFLIAGFLRSEGFLSSLEDILELKEEEGAVRLTLKGDLHLIESLYGREEQRLYRAVLRSYRSGQQ